MHHVMALTYLYAAGIEPRPWLTPPPPRRPRRRRTQVLFGRLLVGAGAGLQRVGRWLSGTGPMPATTERRAR